MKFLTGAEILDALDLKREAIPCPEWTPAGAELRHVWIAEFSGEQRDRYDMTLAARRQEDGTVDLVGMRAVLVSLAAVNDAGDPLFTPDDVERLSAKNGAALDRLFDAAMRLNKLGKRAEDDTVKNS